MIYYIFSVSHVVLLMNDGEMKMEMANAIKLCAGLLINANQKKILSPTIYMIFNKLTG